MSINILQKAILSEKAYAEINKGVYTFMVDKRANKKDIKKTVEDLFSVEVKKVNIVAVQPKQKRVGRTKNFADVGGGKKAIVWLKAGQTISMLFPKTKAKEKKKPKDKEKKEETK